MCPSFCKLACVGLSSGEHPLEIEAFTLELPTSVSLESQHVRLHRVYVQDVLRVGSACLCAIDSARLSQL